MPPPVPPAASPKQPHFQANKIAPMFPVVALAAAQMNNMVEMERQVALLEKEEAELVEEK